VSHLPPHLLAGAEDEVRSGLPSGLTLAAMEKLLIRDDDLPPAQGNRGRRPRANWALTRARCFGNQA